MVSQLKRKMILSFKKCLAVCIFLLLASIVIGDAESKDADVNDGDAVDKTEEPKVTEEAADGADGEDEAADATEKAADATDEAQPQHDNDPLRAFEKYKKLFTYHRDVQTQGLNMVFGKMKGNAERKKIIDAMVKTIFKLSAEAKQNLTEVGFAPGDAFPIEQHVKESYSKIIENTGMFSEIILKFPELTHEVFDKEDDWKGLLKWSYDFCLASEVFEGENYFKLELMAKEGGLLPKDAKFHNPYREGPPPKKRFEDPKPAEKKKKKKIQRGPKLSHSEL